RLDTGKRRPERPGADHSDAQCRSSRSGRRSSAAATPRVRRAPTAVTGAPPVRSPPLPLTRGRLSPHALPGNDEGDPDGLYLRRSERLPEDPPRPDPEQDRGRDRTLPRLP